MGVLGRVDSGTGEGEVGSGTDLDQGSHLDAFVGAAGLLLGRIGGFEVNTLVLHHHRLSLTLPPPHPQTMSLHLNLQRSLHLLCPVHFYSPAPLH